MSGVHFPDHPPKELAMLTIFSSRRNRPHSPRSRNPFRPRVEALEERALLDAGGLDPAFGDAGRVLTPFTGDAAASTVLVQPDGKIVVIGRADGVDFALTRYNADGRL